MKYEGYNNFKVINVKKKDLYDNEEDLNNMPAGWDLLEIVNKQETQTEYNGNDTSIAVYNHPVAILGQKEGSVVADLQTEIDELNSTISALKHDVKYRTDTYDELVKERDGIKRDHENTCEKYDILKSDTEGAIKAMRTLENDIVKIRQAIGELKMKEILES